MKKKINFLRILLVLAVIFVACEKTTFSLNAQQISYYYHGQKIDLTVSKDVSM